MITNIFLSLIGSVFAFILTLSRQGEITTAFMAGGFAFVLCMLMNFAIDGIRYHIEKK